jgi:hypothetical protein
MWFHLILMGVLFKLDLHSNNLCFAGLSFMGNPGELRHCPVCTLQLYGRLGRKLHPCGSSAAASVNTFLSPSKRQLVNVYDVRNDDSLYCICKDVEHGKNDLL